MESNLEIIERTGALANLCPQDLEMLKKSGNKLGGRLCSILRHRPETIGVAMDLQGWVSVDELLEKFNAYYTNQRYGLTFPALMELVRTDGKQRYGLKGEGTNLKIRCRQGHSIPWLEMDFQEAKPPKILYHGTIHTFLKDIMSDGLRPMERNKVHLSIDIDTAKKVAKRRKTLGNPIILQVDAEQMAKDGIIFYLSDNDIWMVDYAASKYLSKIV